MDARLFKTLNQTAVITDALDPNGTGISLPPYKLQSATYNSAKNVVVLGFNWDDTDTPDTPNTTNKALLVEMTPDFSEVVAGYEIDGLYHCNDLTYNPNTNKIYVALCDTTNIARINASTMAFEGIIQFNFTGAEGSNKFLQVVYDADKNIYYIGNSAAIHTTDANFSVTNSVMLQNYSVEKTVAISAPIGAEHNNGHLTLLQGGDIVNGEFARVWSISEGAPYDNCVVRSSRIEFCDLETGAVSSFVDFPTRHQYHEAEAIVTVGEKQYLIGRGWSNIYVEELSQGLYNFTSSSVLSADQTVSVYSSNLVTNKAVAERVYHKKNSGNLLDFALSLPAGIHAVQNLGSATPSKFQYTLSIVEKNESGDRCAVYAVGYGDQKFYFNTYFDSEWSGWRCCATTLVDDL